MRLEPPAQAGMGPGSPKLAGKEDRQEGGTAQGLQAWRWRRKQGKATPGLGQGKPDEL